MNTPEQIIMPTISLEPHERTCSWQQLPEAIRTAERDGYHVHRLKVEAGSYTLHLIPDRQQ